MPLLTTPVTTNTGIRSFRDKDTEAIWQRHHVKKLAPELSRSDYSKLVLLNAAESFNDLRVPPGNRLEKEWPAFRPVQHPGQRSVADLLYLEFERRRRR